MITENDPNGLIGIEFTMPNDFSIVFKISTYSKCLKRYNITWKNNNIENDCYSYDTNQIIDLLNKGTWCTKYIERKRKLQKNIKNGKNSSSSIIK